MSNSEMGQVISSAADVYEKFFVPALFQEWTAPVADAAGIGQRQRVLDVACGTGVLARAIAERVGAEGSVVGIDLNEGMLAVARRKSPAIEWRQGRAEALPFDNESFDGVVSQFGLMFFEDRTAALHEMWRVLRAGGGLAAAVWDSLDRTPGYAAATALLQRLFGTDIANALRAPFVLGDTEYLRSLFDDAGIPEANVATHIGTARFPSIEAWIYTDIKGWTLADSIDDAQFDRLREEANRELQRFVTRDGTVAFDSPVHIVSATKAA